MYENRKEKQRSEDIELINAKLRKANKEIS